MSRRHRLRNRRVRSTQSLIKLPGCTLHPVLWRRRRCSGRQRLPAGTRGLRTSGRTSVRRRATAFALEILGQPSFYRGDRGRDYSFMAQGERQPIRWACSQPIRVTLIANTAALQWASRIPMRVTTSAHPQGSGLDHRRLLLIERLLDRAPHAVPDDVLGIGGPS
jgi:hypothetical protein